MRLSALGGFGLGGYLDGSMGDLIIIGVMAQGILGGFALALCTPLPIVWHAVIGYRLGQRISRHSLIVAPFTKLGNIPLDAEIEALWRSEFQTAPIERVHTWLEREPGLASAPVDCTLKSGSVRRWSPLFVASNHLRDLGKVKALVEAGADLTNGEWGTHWPSEDYAINAYLIERGIDVNQPSYLGFHAIGVTGLDSFFLILEHGLDPNSTWPHNGESLLHVQARHDDDAHLARAHALIRAGANVNVQALSGLDEELIMDNEHFVQFGRETPLHVAARLGNIKHVHLLLAHGADSTLRTVSKMVEPKQFVDWPTDVAALMWPKQSFQQLVFEPYDGETPLDMAVREGHDQIAEVLRSGRP